MATNMSIFAKLVARDQMSGVFRNVANSSSRLSGSLKQMTVQGAGMQLGMSAVNKVMSSLSAGVDGAIKRYDTLNNLTPTLKNLGVSAGEAEAALNKLKGVDPATGLSDAAKGLNGLPTTLDAAASGVKRFVAANGDIDKSTDYWLAMNDAIVAGGASVSEQESAIEQLSQAYSKGKFEMEEWKAFQQAAPGQLKQVADAMGMTTNGLYESLQKGNTSMDEFMDTIVKLDKGGVKGIKAFSEQARDATGGIGTSLTNLKTTIVKGITDTLGNIDTLLGSQNALPFDSISGGLKLASQGISDSFKKMNAALGSANIEGVIKGLTPYVNMLSGAAKTLGAVLTTLIGVINNNAGAIARIGPLVWAAASAYAGLAVVPGIVAKVNTSVATMNKVIGLTKSVALKSSAAVKTSILQMQGISKVTSSWKAATAALNQEQAALSTINKLYGANAASIYKGWNATAKATGMTKKFIGVQRALNLVMKANPIIFVVGLIASLIVALGALQASGKDVAGSIENFANTLSSKIDSIAGILPEVIESFVESITANMPKIIESAVGIIQALATGIANAAPTLVLALPAILAALVKGIITVVPALVKAGAQILVALYNGIKASVPALKSGVVKIGKNIPGWIKMGLKGLAAIGANVVTGLWQGIGNKASWLKSKIKGMVGNVKNWLKKFFKIGSPSRLMAKEIGRFIPMGIGVGIEKKADTVIAPLKDIAATVAEMSMPIPDFAIPGYSGSLSEDFSYGGNFSIEVPLYVNSREFAKATSDDMQHELETKEIRSNRKRGRK